MKCTKHSEDAISKTSRGIKSALMKKKSDTLKVSKLSVQNKKKFAKAKILQQKISRGDDDSMCCDALRQLNLSDIMSAINELLAEPDPSTMHIGACSSQMAQDFEICWTSPRAILRAIKYAILKRNWDSITHLLLLLLQHKDQYVFIVRKLCLFIAKYNPMIQKLGLREEFEILNERRT